jgi:RimJ/RimL family protein N-acetyltransferase
MTRQIDLTSMLNEESSSLVDESSEMTSPVSTRTRRPKAIRQTFLVGPTIYLRPIQLSDALTAPFWDPSPFPVSADVVEENLKTDIAPFAVSGTRRLIASRRSDDMPIGSTEMHSEDGRTTDVTFHVPVVFGPNRRSEVIAEMIRLLVPWLLHEHDQMAVRIRIPGDDEIMARAARTCKMTEAFVLREAYLGPNNVRDHMVCWQVLHPTWVARLGVPEPAVFGNVERVTRSPAPRVYPKREKDPPANAMLVGNRIYLRPIQQVDAESIASWAMRETETSFDIGRSPRSPISYWHWNRKNYEANPPNWIRFAICLLEDDTVIGANGLAFIDWINRKAESETEIVQPEFRGGGYGTEAKHLLLEYAFDILGLNLIESVAWAFNTPSCAALRKQGYRDAGRMSWTGIKNGDFVDDLVFDLLADEWRAARG